MPRPRSKRPRSRTSRRPPAPTLAQLADRHDLYQKAVQSPDVEIDFLDRVFRRLHGCAPARLREDFCGPAANCCEFVRRRSTNRAVGIDLHQPTLDWGLAHNVPKLKPSQAARLRLLRRNVLTPGPGTGGMDAVLALNFSYWVFKDRPTLLRYFRAVHRSLARGGLFILDIWGGWEILKELKERTPVGGTKRGFTYIWEQARCDPISHETLCYIHFRMRDGSRIQRAFTYDWRAWTTPEVREVMAEAGFRRSTVYWEGEDSDGEGNGVFRPAKRAENGASFVAYIVAER